MENISMFSIAFCAWAKAQAEPLGKEGLRMQKVQKMFSGTGSVFWVTAGLSAALIVWGVFFTGNFTAVITVTFDFIIANLS